MKVSVITVCYNSSAFIKTCIDSVISQNYSDIEYIIVDGLSNDNTMEIVYSYGDKITKIVSEKDGGTYDAMNKGIKMATGEIIAILNSDDLFYDNQVIERVVKSFKNTQADLVYADIVYITGDNLDKIVRYYSPKNHTLKDLEYGLIPPHPGVFVRKSCYEKYGTFHDTKYRICCDYDLLVRLLYVHKVPFYYLPIIATKMRTGGSSSLTFKTFFQINGERIRSCKANNVPTNYLKLYVKYLEKFFQLFKRPKI